jgi:hypothetical protein
MICFFRTIVNDLVYFTSDYMDCHTTFTPPPDRFEKHAEDGMLMKWICFTIAIG